MAMEPSASQRALSHASAVRVPLVGPSPCLSSVQSENVIKMES